MTTATNPYAVQSVQTASPARLVTMLYDRLLTALSRVQTSLADDGVDGYELVNRELQRAQDILNELRHSLDHAAGGEVARSLDSLYAFCLEQVMKANLSKKAHGLDVVVRIITDIREVWLQSCDQPGADLFVQ